MKICYRWIQNNIVKIINKSGVYRVAPVLTGFKTPKRGHAGRQIRVNARTFFIHPSLVYYGFTTVNVYTYHGEWSPLGGPAAKKPSGPVALWVLALGPP